MEEAATPGGAPTIAYAIGDDILSQATATSVSHLLHDGHSSTRLLTDSTGAVSSRYDFDAYGSEVGFKADEVSAPATNILYAGEQFDRDLQCYYLRARYYNQAVGSFTSFDSFDGSNFDPQSLHKYAFAHSDPVNRIDPSGHFSTLEVSVAASITQMVLVMQINSGIKFLQDIQTPDAFALQAILTVADAINTVIAIYQLIKVAIAIAIKIGQGISTLIKWLFAKPAISGSPIGIAAKVYINKYTQITSGPVFDQVRKLASKLGFTGKVVVLKGEEVGTGAVATADNDIVIWEKSVNERFLYRIAWNWLYDS